MRSAALIKAELEQRDLLELLANIARDHHVSVDEMLSPARWMPLPQARAEFWRELRDRGFSLPRIGALFGMHHSSILHGLRGATVHRPRVRVAEDRDLDLAVGGDS